MSQDPLLTENFAFWDYTEDDLPLLPDLPTAESINEDPDALTNGQSSSKRSTYLSMSCLILRL